MQPYNPQDVVTWNERKKARQQHLDSLRAQLKMHKTNHFLLNKLPKAVTKEIYLSNLEKKLAMAEKKPHGPNIVNIMQGRHLGKKFV